MPRDRMKVLAFQGSPRIEGNTDILLKETLKPVHESGHDIRLFKLNSMNIKPCQDCGGCDKTGKCIINDDIDEIYDAIREADRIILASPIFFFGVSAQAKIMIDRCQAFWCEKYLLNKPIPEGRYGRKGLLLLVGGMKKEVGIQCAEATAKAFFRTVSVSEHETLSFTGVDAKGAILEHPTALKETYEAGKRLVAIQSG
ncbi:flavodoxin family protein [Dissulfurispira sp.]|uniref:flavodoxin family protein n=1 Tax=Dissulfurispira sp. TaxID=2817609 RepID=UPI002FDB8CDD